MARSAPLVRVQVPSAPRDSVRARNAPLVRVQVPSAPKDSVRARNGPMLPVPAPSVRKVSVPARSGPMLPAQVLSGPWTGVRLPASSHVQPARVSVCASAVAVRS